MKERRIFIRFCVLQAAYWSFFAAFPGYISAFALSKGVSTSLLGVILAANMLCALSGSLVWGRWVDKNGASRKFYLLGNGVALFLCLLLYFFGRSPLVLLITYSLFGFMTGPIPTTLDAWVITAFPQRSDAAARSRAFGTLGFAVVMLLMGQLIVRFGYGAMPAAALFFMAVNFIVAPFQPKGRAQAEIGESGTEIAPAQENPRQLLSSRRYVLMAAAVFFTGMAISPINTMKLVLLENVGGDVSVLGWDSFIGCMIQAPFLMLAGKMRHVRSDMRLLTGAGFAMLYALFVIQAGNPLGVIMGTICNNISFGILFPTMREMTEESVSSGLRNTAHGIIDIAYGSLAGMLATSWSGAILEHSGIAAMGSICIAMQTIGISFCFAILMAGRKRRKISGPPCASGV